MNKDKTILVTGCAGFIGFHLTKRLMLNGIKVIGFDNLNEYYDISIKLSRLKELENIKQKFDFQWEFIKGDLENKDKLEDLFKSYQPKIVINLAAQAGVRYSIENPSLYVNSNIVGFLNILECCKLFKIENLLYASSSSVYGGNKKIPFSEKDPVNHPVSLYAATKKSNELMAHVYSHLFNIPAIGLRFFTVYGPWGRPDMAPMIFAKAILAREPIEIYNHGNMLRDFTFIDDVIDTLEKLIEKPATPEKEFDYESPNPGVSWAPHKIFNVGNNNPINLMDFINLLENECGGNAIKIFKDIQPGDVIQTFSENKNLKEWISFSPSTPINEGVKKFINWYKNFYIKEK